MGIIAIYFSMIFAELVGMFPKEGGVYEYAKEAFGQFPSFLLGWMALIAANVTIAMLVVGAIKYIGPILPESLLITFSIAFIVIFNYIAYRGLKTGAVMLVVFAFITLISLFGIIRLTVLPKPLVWISVQRFFSEHLPGHGKELLGPYPCAAMCNRPQRPSHVHPL